MKFLLSVVLFLVLPLSSVAQSTGTILLVDATGTEVIAYETGDTAHIRLTDLDRNSDTGLAETVDVTVSSAVEADETVTLTETGPNTGVFEGTFTFEAAASPTAADGVLQIGTGKPLTAAYDDPDDDFGNPQTVSDNAFFGVTLVSGPVAINTTWRKADSPFLVTGDVTVQNGAKLTLEPGVEVRFLPATDDQRAGEDANRSELIVFGEISALGTEADSIRFTSNSNAPTTGDWYGIRLQDSNAKAQFGHSVFAYATYGLRMRDLRGTVLDTVSVYASRFSSLGTGINNYRGYRFFQIEHNLMEDLGNVLQFEYAEWRARVSFHNNLVRRKSGEAAYFEYYDHVSLTDNRFENGQGQGPRVYRTNHLIATGNTISGQAGTGLSYLGYEIRGTVQIAHNQISGNQSSGLFVQHSSDALIRGNELLTNGENGLYLSQSFARVDSNTVRGNLHDGIHITTDFNNPVVDSLLYNTITGNGGDGVENQDYGRPVLHYNNLHSNVGYDVNNRSTQHPELNARFNWWGDNNTAIMNTGGNPKNIDKIYDQFDEPAIGFVNYGGWLSEEVDITLPPQPPTGVTPAFLLTIRVSDSASHQVDLSVGVADDASDSYDETVDLLAPPPPPQGNFDARIRGLSDFLTDVRGSNVDAHTWTILFQSAAGAAPATLAWDPSSLPVEGSFRLRDPFGGALINLDMRLASSYTPPEALTQIEVSYRAKEEITVAVSEGWNIVGTPLSVADPDYMAVFPSAQPRTLFQFEGNYSIPDPTELTPGRGYWLRFEQAGDAHLEGVGLVDLEIDLNAGWNLVSGPNCSLPLASVSDPSSIILPGTLFGFDGSYSAATTLEPGSGYWLRISAAGTLGLDCSAATKGLRAIATLDGFNAIGLTDAAGTRQELLLGGLLPDGTSELAYTAPPTSPGTSFRAAFLDGRYVRPAESGEVVLSGARFPVVLTSAEPLSVKAWAGETIVASYEVAAENEISIEDPAVSRLQLGQNSEAEVPLTFALEQNYPNPFNPQTRIRFGLPEAAKVTLEVFDALGRRVATVLNEERPAGWHEVSFDGRSLGSGMYFYALRAGDRVASRPMAIIK
ncbi:MAG: T9SS type A sorting domain-containing protein [Rhodothermales bacterium]|nr:T9SS type A sorting domain-containing protein [Rhodothermales bacterium]